MRINTNISAMNTYSRLTAANNSKSGSLAKLSSGLRINRAGDDAAGLAISEKMRGQIGGLKQATRNAQDAISLIQTAEGGLSETHSILNRMRELAVQSSNDTNTQADRLEIQKEVDQLSTEITRIASDTQFNTQNLLGGDFSAKFQIGANKDQNIDLKIKDMGSEKLNLTGKVNSSKTMAGELKGIDVRSLTGDISTSISTKALGDKDADVVEKTTAKFNEITKEIEITLAQAKGDGTDPGAVTATQSDVYEALKSVAGKSDLVFNTNDDFDSKDLMTVATGALVAGAWTEDETASKSAGIAVSTQAFANDAILIIDDAIANVSAERSKLGATQNRLDHTINNLTATSENLSEAESRIRDVDMAQEMMEFTKSNILSQAATAMLAQANQMPQGVLQLLQ